ncbi:branched-chain amino acid transport system permease protein [Paenibacillus sp. yr247]|uniref:branched-chain amino acid ABC transporter permease n=1 Tax=Paenibacillus sp. yr247 TaxID=1761880 RepID=UPI00088F58C9|nr:branched-chain amino acid ABC transporter permease [Paenibacillus sp. yr247]SDO03304.1 branched-chain amino acid transport system permease protein [Paenibacillus sp. yr247]
MRFQNKNFWYGIGVSVVIYGLFQILLTRGIMNDVAESTLILICINIVLGVSLNLINGFAGQFSLGHAGFMAVGAYVSAILTLDFQFPFPLALLVGGLIAAVFGLMIGIPTLRLKGDYLAIATLGFGEIIRIVLLNTDYVGGASGLSGIPALTTWTWTFIFTLFTVVVINNFINSTHGRAVISIRENEIAAEAMGINTTKYKVIAFAIGAFFAGIAGGMIAHKFYVISPNSFNFMKSFEILVIVVLGGLGSTSGAIVGAIVLTLLFTFLQDFPELRMMIYSIILIGMMIFRPKGLLGTKEFSFNFLNKKKEGEQRGTK